MWYAPRPQRYDLTSLPQYPHLMAAQPASATNALAASTRDRPVPVCARVSVVAMAVVAMAVVAMAVVAVAVAAPLVSDSGPF